VGDSGVQFALEHTDHVSDRHRGTGRAPCCHDLPPFMEEYIPPWLN
jgi:hypothetical protein